MRVDPTQPYRAVQNRGAPYKTVQHCTEPYRTVLYESDFDFINVGCELILHSHTAPCRTVRNRAAPCCGAPCRILHSTVQNCAAPCGIVQHHTELCSFSGVFRILAGPRPQQERLSLEVPGALFSDAVETKSSLWRLESSLCVRWRSSFLTAT